MLRSALPARASGRPGFAASALVKLSLCALAASPAAAWAQTEPVPDATAGAADNTEGEDQTGKKKKKKKHDLAGADAFNDSEAATIAAGTVDIEVHGRVQVLGLYERETLFDRVFTMEDSTRPRLNFDVTSARAGVKARVHDKVSLVLEADFADGVDLKDGYVQWKSKRALLRVGQFKMPLSAFTLESPWTMPMARRGHLHEHLADNLGLFGRRVGLLAQAKGGGWLDPAVAFGVFESGYWASDTGASPKIKKGDPLRNAKAGQQTFVARASVSPGSAELAAVARLQRGEVAGLADSEASLWLFGAEATVDHEGETSGFRLWAEAYAGQSLYDDNYSDLGKVAFAAGRGLGAWRLGGLGRGAPYVEPFVGAGALSPELGESGNLYWETTLGVGIGHWKQSRLTVQYEHGQAARTMNRSRQFGLGQDNSDDVLTHDAVVVQAGAAF